jgi:hypothetical protein
MQFSCNDFLARCTNDIGFSRLQKTDIPVGLSASLFDISQCNDQLGMVPDGNTGYVKVTHGSHGLNAIVGIGWHLLITKQVMLPSKVSVVCDVRVFCHGCFPVTAFP